jgi:O-antigen/teichoic acid export membrane protein|tara:strand:+ start:3681 stop:4973 length:1293 start_codon:yes stop_codon:yes gene_type:complete
LKLPKFISENLLLKITSLNAVVISIRLVISLFIQRFLAEIVGEVGISKIGQLRNFTMLLTSISSGGVFNGIIKYVSEYKEDKEQLQKMFSTAFVFTVIGSSIACVSLLIGAEFISEYLFGSINFKYLIKLLAVIVPFIGIYRVFNGVVHGLSQYKNFAKIDLFGYLLGAFLLVISIYNYNIDGALVAIAVTPILQLLVLLYIFFKTLKEYVKFSKLSLKIPFAKELLAFTLMSFVSTGLLSFVEIDIRTMIRNQITEADSGIWTAMTFISKNYMVFSASIFTLYVVPKFAIIHTKKAFTLELKIIYKTILPLFGVGMLLVYFLRDYVILIIYPDFTAMAPLFKWQLTGDFVRLATLVLGHQFIAKKMMKNFIFSEIISLALFYFLSHYLIKDYGVEGVVMAHLVRSIIMFGIIYYLVIRYFRKQNKSVKE